MANRIQDAWLAVTATGTLIAGTPASNGAWRVRRCRPMGDVREPRQRDMQGAIAVVGAMDRELPIALCGGQAYGVLDPDPLLPMVGKRLAVGATWTDRGLDVSGGEVTSQVQWARAIAPDRRWTVQPMLRAWSNGDRKVADMLREQSWELGDEAIVDTTGRLSTNALEAFYHRRIAAKAAVRTSRARRRGLEVELRSVTVSNEQLDAAVVAVGLMPHVTQDLLDRRLAGGVTGWRNAGADNQHAEALSVAVDAHLAWLFGLEVPLRTVRSTSATLATALMAAAGPGMRELKKRPARRYRGRIASSLDEMLASVKRWGVETGGERKPAAKELAAAA